MGATIPVADNEVRIFEVAASLLADEGYRILVVRDGATVPSLVERRCPDMLITENLMPGPTGVELVTLLHAHPGLAMPVILMGAVAPVALPPRRPSSCPSRSMSTSPGRGRTPRLPTRVETRPTRWIARSVALRTDLACRFAAGEGCIGPPAAQERGDGSGDIRKFTNRLPAALPGRGEPPGSDGHAR